MRFVSLLILMVSVLPAQSSAILTALATGTYFPLDVGDRWVYREDDRLTTAQYQTWRVDRTATQNGTVYSVIAIEGPGTSYAEYWFRANSSGQVYILTGNGEQLFLDPNIVAPNSGEVQLTGPGGAVTTPLGTFPDTVNYVNPMGLELESGTLARGIGVLSSTTILETGSSGGPTLIRTLVEAVVAGGIHFPALTSAVDLGIESLNLNVSAMQVTNCAVPCYFVACGLLPGADPAGTYKPCARARVALRNWPAGLSRTVRLQLLAPGGAAAYDQTLTLDAAANDSVTFVQVPLYSAPNQPLSAGAYQLTAASSDGAAQSSVTVQIR
jgi:hypothetical protein